MVTVSPHITINFFPNKLSLLLSFNDLLLTYSNNILCPTGQRGLALHGADTGIGGPFQEHSPQGALCFGGGGERAGEGALFWS